jgi:hypothetical protein
MSGIDSARPHRTRNALVALLGVVGQTFAVGACSTAGPEVDVAQVLYAFDIHDPAAVAENTDAVFVATVVGKGKVIDRGSVVPFTEYTVAVDDVLTGDVSGTVVVEQEGGRGKDGTVYVHDGDVLLEEGSRYMLAGSEGSSGKLIVWPFRGTAIDDPGALRSLTAEFEKALGRRGTENTT